MQIFPNVYEIKSQFGDRYIQQYLFVGEQVVLLDSGIVSTPESAIFPYLEKIGIPPSRLSLVVAMHADGDHHGGLPSVKSISSTTALACHEGDRRLIEDPERLYQDRYNFLAHDHGLGSGREGMIYSPNACKIDVVLSGRQTLDLSKDWKLKVWHVPGHSEGHLAIYDEKNKAAFTSDAVQVDGYSTIDGKMAFGPTYFTVDAYLATIHFLENQPIEHMFTGHWPGVHGAGVKSFLDRTRQFVERADELIKDYLKTHRKVTLKAMMHDLSPKLGSWPQEMDVMLQYALFGHMERLKERGLVQASKTVPVEYSMA
jgi:glyoxylase-like metal-dependent hydrolase (beta-lactamase superfamily II)